MEARRAKLEGLKVGALRRHARSLGVDMAHVERLIDDEDKPAIVELVLATEAEAADALRAELAQAKVGVLRKRAKSEGADMEWVTEAIDEEDKAAIVELIVEAIMTKAIPEGVPPQQLEPEPEPELEPEPQPQLDHRGSLTS